MTFEIRNLGPAEKIVEPGFYSMPLERHHNQPCDGVSVTSSVLRTMREGTPADVWSFHVLNPDRFEPKSTPAFTMGSAIAAYIEGGEDQVRADFFVLPDDKPNRPTTAQMIALREGRASDKALASISFWGKVDKDPRRKISEADVRRIEALGKVLAKHELARMMLSGIPEVTMAWKDQATGIWCLSRPDQVHFSGEGFDYKSIAIRDAYFQPRHVDRRITEHSLFMQMGFADEAFEHLAGDRMTTVGFVFQLNEAPYHVIPRALEDEEVLIGRALNRQSLDRFAECYDTGVWPGPGEHVGAYRMPEKYRERLLEELNIEGKAP